MQPLREDLRADRKEDRETDADQRVASHVVDARIFLDLKPFTGQPLRLGLLGQRGYAPLEGAVATLAKEPTTPRRSRMPSPSRLTADMIMPGVQ